MRPRPFPVIFVVAAALTLSACESGEPVVVVSPSLGASLIFEPNHGQLRADTEFAALGTGFSLSLGSSGILFELANIDESDDQPLDPAEVVRTPGESTLAEIQFEGISGSGQIVGEYRQPGLSHYFIGADRANWRTHVPHYERVRYASLYPDIDLVVHSRTGELKADFVVSPGGDPESIKLRFTADEVSLSEEGDVVFAAGDHRLELGAPVSYQLEDGLPVSSEYVIDAAGIVSVRVGDYDRGTTLIIDPPLRWTPMSVSGPTTARSVPTPFGQARPLQPSNSFVSAFLAGGPRVRPQDMVVDADGFVYIAGSAAVSFVQTHGFPSPPPATDPIGIAFVTKLDPDLETVLFSTLLIPDPAAAPDSRSAASGWGVDLDLAGNVYVSGFTTPGFPIAPVGSVAQATHAGGGPTEPNDGFVTKLSPDGDLIVYSTYIGGTLDDQFRGSLDVDPFGAVYVAGLTESTSLQAAGAGAPGRASAGGFSEGIIAKLNPAGSRLEFFTFVGGSGSDSINDIGVHSDGTIYVGGFSNSPTLPLVNPIPGTHVGALAANDPGDGFVARLSEDGRNLIFATRLGGSATTSADSVRAIGVDPLGQVFVAGSTRSTDFLPTGAQATAFQPALNGTQARWLRRATSRRRRARVCELPGRSR